MGMLYSNIYDTINLRRFDAVVPENYEPVTHDFFKENGTIPFFGGAVSESDTAMTKITVAEVVDMCYNNVSFQICNTTDNKLIFEILRDYLDITRPLMVNVPNTDDSKVFFQKALTAFNQFQKYQDAQTRFVENTTPESKKRKTLDSLLKRLGI